MKAISALCLLLLASATALTLYLPKQGATNTQAPLYSVDKPSIDAPINYADLSIAQWEISASKEKPSFGLLLSIVNHPTDAAKVAERWSELAASVSPTLPLVLFTLKDDQRSWQALMLGPASSTAELGPYQSLATGQRFANELLLWPVSDKKADDKDAQ